MEFFYKFLPYQIQNFIISGYGYYWKWRRFGGNFRRDLIEIKNRENWTVNQWNLYQKDVLLRLLSHAKINVPFYRNKIKIDEGNFYKKSYNNILEHIPILEKEDLRKFGKSELIAGNKQPGHFYQSSGSSGTPTNIYYSFQFHRTWSALFEARIRHWAGVNKKMSRGMIGGRRILPQADSNGPNYRFNLAERQVYFSAYHISPNNVSKYLDGMFRYGIQYLTGYAESNYILARMIKEKGLPAPKLRAVITSSEKLTPEMRSLFQEIYGCKTYDSYSGVEACGLISECEFGSLHVSPDAGIIEILDEQGKPVGPGQTGEAVCTGLINFDQPLIRYRIGDRLTLAKEQECLCGRNMPIISQINGRIEDVIRGIDGREMVRFHGIFINLPEVLRGQIVQSSYSNIIVNVECKSNLSENSRLTMINRVKSQLGALEVEVRQVDKIPLSPNGKFKAVVSNIKSS